MSTGSDDSDLDDFMESMGLDIKPTGPEDALMIKLNGGIGSSQGYKEIYNYRYWIRHELYAYFNLIKDGCMMVRESQILKKQVPYTKMDYVRTRTKYYLNMKYLPWFNSDVSGLGKADINKVCDMLIEHEAIKPLVEADEKDLPINNSY